MRNEQYKEPIDKEVENSQIEGVEDLVKPKFNIKINQSIENALAKFETSEKGGTDFSQLFKMIFNLKNNPASSVDFHFSWKTDQIEKIIDAFNEHYKEKRPVGEFTLLPFLFSRDYNSKEGKTANDYFADELTERIRNGRSFNSGMENEINL